MKKLKKSILLLALMTLTSCGTSNNFSSSASNSTSTNGTVTTSTKNDSSSSSDTYTNDIDEFTVQDRIDITSDFDSQKEEDFSSITNVIDLSTLSDGEVKTITDGGSYLLSGTNENARVVINSSADVVLILNGIDLTSKTDAPIEVKTASSLTVHIASKTKNYLKDTSSNTLEAAFVVKKVALNIEGDGYLYVTSNGLEDNDSGVGIQASKGLNITNSHVIIDSTSHSLNAKAGLEIKSSKLYLTSKKDAIHSKEGGVTISDSILDCDTYGDGIDAFLDVSIKNTTTHFNSTATYVLFDASLDTDESIYEDSKYVLENGEYKKISSDDMTRYNTRYYLEQKCKGVKSEAKVSFTSGTHYFYTADDSIASDTEIDILSGDYVFYTKDQAINSDQILNIGSEGVIADNLNIHIYNSYEGIQGGVINFYDGYTYILASDDGINATSDTLTSVSMNFHENSIVYVNASGDGIDSNGDILMDGGDLIVVGPTSNGDGSLDFDGKFTYTGGNIFAVGSNGMIQTPNTDSINVVSCTMSGLEKDTLLSVFVDEIEFSMILPKTFSSLNVIVGSKSLVIGQTVKFVKNSTTNASFKNGVYMGNVTSSGGETLQSSSISQGLTNIGSSNGQGGNPGGNQPGQQGPGGNHGGRP